MRCLPPINCRISQPQYEISSDMSLTFNPTGHFATVQGWNNKNCLQTGSSEIRDTQQPATCLNTHTVFTVNVFHIYMNIWYIYWAVKFQPPRYPKFPIGAIIWTSCKIIKLPDRSACLWAMSPKNLHHCRFLDNFAVSQAISPWFLVKSHRWATSKPILCWFKDSKPPFSYTCLLHSNHSLPNWLDHVVPIFDRRSCKGPTTLEHMERMDMELWEGQTWCFWF